MSLIKSISGIRGTIGGAVDENLTPLDIVKFTSAFGTWLQQQHNRKQTRHPFHCFLSFLLRIYEHSVFVLLIYETQAFFNSN